MKKAYLLLFILFTITVFSQKKKEIVPNEDYFLMENDSTLFELEGVNVLKKLKLDNKDERRYYYWYRKKIHKAYPFALKTASKLNKIDAELAKIKSKRKRKKHIKKAQKLLNEEFKGKLKKLTKTEGKLLIRLIHRQTGHTVFRLIKKYRSGWKAFWYNNTANLFKLSLKKEYHPESKELDFLVEDILQHAFTNGTLIKQDSKLNFNYLDISVKYKNIDIVKVIDNR